MILAVQAFPILLSLSLLHSVAFGFGSLHTYRRQLQLMSDDNVMRSQKTPKSHPTDAYFFAQKVDHFNRSDTRAWSQLYYYNSQMYRSGGPCFLFICGEISGCNNWWIGDYGQPAIPFLLNARNHSAAVFMLEHRFYSSESAPADNLSVENLRLLTARQAIEDVAVFIRTMNVLYGFGDGAQWVTFGGSYAGMLSAWMRVKYPALTVGSIASSAPVLAKMNFVEYMDVVRDSLNTFDPACMRVVRDGFAQMVTMMKSISGTQEIEKLFNFCHPLNQSQPNDLPNFYANVASVFQAAVQYNGVQAYSGDLAASSLCRRMLNMIERDPVKRIADVVVFTYYSNRCMDNSYDRFIRGLNNTSFQQYYFPYRAWTWQTCNEFGFFQSTDSANDIFAHTIPLSFFIDQCKDLFGASFTNEAISASVASTNAYFGGRDNFNASNVVLPNGSIDPWHVLGIVNSTTDPTVVPLLINGTAHCADMYYPRPTDPPGLVAAKVVIHDRIASWLSSSLAATSTTPASTTATAMASTSYSGAADRIKRSINMLAVILTISVSSYIVL